jgi:hypothetical protein
MKKIHTNYHYYLVFNLYSRLRYHTQTAKKTTLNRICFIDIFG